MNKQYLKYKKDFKKQCWYTSIGGGFALLSIIFLLFLPNFKIKDNSISKNFSLFDEIMLVFKVFTSNDLQYLGLKIYYIVFGTFQIIAIILFLVAIIKYLFELIKSISAICNMDDYALEQYDKIKTRARGRKKGHGRGSSLGYCIGGIVLEIIYIVSAKTILNILPIDKNTSVNLSGFIANVSGVSLLIIITVLTVLILIVLFVMRNKNYKNVYRAIVREDYGLADDDYDEYDDDDYDYDEYDD